MKKFDFPLFALFMLLLFLGNSFAQNNSSVTSIQKSEDEKVYKQSEVDQKAKIIKRPHPSTDRMCGNDSGFVRVSVVLHKSGKVGDVKSLKSSECQRFNENSLDSAKKIKYNPAVKDGQPVSVSVLVEYTYRRF
jgi:TonB family protein